MNRRGPRTKPTLASVAALLLVACSDDGPDVGTSDGGSNGGPIVDVVPTADGGWQLLRHGEPYEVKGAGFAGDLANLEALAEAGANTIRVFGTQGADQLLDAAQAQDMTVLLGIWLGHVNQGFDYDDPVQVTDQLERARQAVERHKDHPALLAWGVGNEMELNNDTPALWDAVEDVAAMIQREDPDHPTVVITAEVGAANEQRIRDRMDSIDVWGINSYGGLASLQERLDDRGWTGPYFVTEYGPNGGWEVPQTSWGAPAEPHGDVKSQAYRLAWDRIRSDPKSLGGYAFVWGNNDRPLDTWYSLLTPTGQPLEATESLRELWGGSPASNLPPRFALWSFSAEGQRVAAGAPMEAALEAVDDQALTFTWVVHPDSLDLSSGSAPPVLCEPEAGGTLSFVAPTAAGPYRVLGVARDPEGAATLASGRFFVEDDGNYDAAPPVRVSDFFASSGWMGDANEGGLTAEPCERPVDYCSDACWQFTFTRRSQGWSGVIWHHPADNWLGDEPGVRFSPGATAVEFSAWGRNGGERVRFFAGNGDAGEPAAELESLELGTEERVYRMELSGGDSEDITAGFGWAAAAHEDPDVSTTFYVTGIRWIAD